MAITELPEKTADSLGLPLVNIRTPQPNQLSAVHVEAIKDNAIQVTTAVGVDDGSTNGSLRQEIFRAKGSGSAEGGTVAKVPGVGGAFKLLRSGFSVDPPGVDDDSTRGYGVGSLWDQVDSLPPWDGPPTRVLWVCKSDYVGAAEWVAVEEGLLLSDATPQALGTALAGVATTASRADHVHATNVSNTLPLALGGVASAGVSPLASRVDHVHPGALPELIESFDFSRATEASYYCPPRPPAYHPGGKTVLAWAPLDVLRQTETGLVIIERTPTYNAAASRTFTGWVGASAGATVTAGYADGPDGVASVAARVLIPGNEYGPYLSEGPGPNAASVWVRRLDGAYAGRMQGILGGGGVLTVEIATDRPEQWTRVDMVSPTTSGDAWIPFDSRATTSPMVATPQDLICDLHSIERGARYATSSTRTNARGRDVLSLDAEDVPQTIRAGVTEVNIELEWPSTAIASGDVRTLYSFGGPSDVLRIRHTGTDVRLEAVVGGSVVCTSGALTWSGRFLAPASLAIVVNPVAGSLSVNGVVTTGTGWVWPTKAFRLGGVWGQSQELDGAISIPRGTPSSRGARDVGSPLLTVVPSTALVMVAGDSEVDGGGFAGDGNSCRKHLVDSFAAASVPINMVGPFATGSFSDNQHAGVGGTTLAAMAGSIGAWLTTYTPDVVVIWAGLNDANAFASAATIATRYGTLLSTMYSARPGCRVVCCLIPHNTGATAQDLVVRDANALLPSVFAASSYGAAGSLAVANLEGCIPTRSPSDVVDSIPHPTRKSFKRVARAMYPAILNALGRNADWAL